MGLEETKRPRNSVTRRWAGSVPPIFFDDYSNMRYWDLLLDWMDGPTGLKISSVQITRWNLISTLIAFAASVCGGWYVGSWRTFAILFGGYFLGAVWMFMRREQSGDG